MTQRSSSTVSASHWCSKCQKFTQHRIDSHRKGPCLECMARLDREHDLRKSLPAPASAEQRSLWGEVL